MEKYSIVVWIAAMGMAMSLIAHVAQAQTTFVDNEAGFIAAADAACGSGAAQTEGYEAPPWDTVRWDVPPFAEAVMITAQGLDWMSNVPGDPITTSTFSARTGGFGFYSRTHGEAFPLPSIFDGFRVETAGTCAFGIWLRTTTVINRPGFILDDTLATGGLLPITDFGWHHFGIVEPGGFYNLEVTEFDGDQGEPKHMFFDDARVYVPEPSFAGSLALGVAAMAMLRRRNQEPATSRQSENRA
jgi:hypothetical protein